MHSSGEYNSVQVLCAKCIHVNDLLVKFSFVFKEYVEKGT